MAVKDVKTLAHELLLEAQEELRQQGHLNPSVVVITAKENMIFHVEYEGEEQREDLYDDIAETAKEKGATTVMTVNDIYLDEQGRRVELQGAGWGKLGERPREAILITVSGPMFETWSLQAPYVRRGDQLIFHPAEERPHPKGEVELLGDWTSRSEYAN